MNFKLDLLSVITLFIYYFFNPLGTVNGKSPELTISYYIQV